MVDVMNNRRLTRLIRALVFSFMLASPCVGADILELKDGSVLDGQYKGGTPGTLRFQTGGQIKVIAVKDVIALSFTGDPNPAPAPAAATPAAGNSNASTSMESKNVPAGTILLVRTKEEIGTKNKSAGDRFTAELESKLMAGTVEIAPAGATVYGKVLKSNKGGMALRKAALELTLTDIKIDGQLKPISTNVLKGEGETGGMGKKILKGAAIGGLADGSSGAGTGAKVGIGIGILAGGKHAGIKAGSLIEFVLQQPFGR